MTWGNLPISEAVEQLAAQVVRPTSGAHWPAEHRHSCLCCGACGPMPDEVRHRQTCPVYVLRMAARTGHDLYTRTDAEVRGMIWDAVGSPLGVVPDSCAEVYAECLRAERRR